MRGLVVTAAALVGLGACTDERPAAETSGTEATAISGTETEAETEAETASETETETETEAETVPADHVDEPSTGEGPRPETQREGPPPTASTQAPSASADSPTDPELAPAPGESPSAAVARCEETSDPHTCVVLALDEREELRARQRQRLIEAHEALGNEARMLDHMEAFLEDYPLDRRGNAYRIALRRAGRE